MIYPEKTLRAIADVSRADLPTEGRDLDAMAALDAIRALPLIDRAELARWVLDDPQEPVSP